MKAPYNRSVGMTNLLTLAFARGASLCDAGGGFLFRVTLRNGAVFEGAPEHDGPDDVGDALALMSGEYMLVGEIVAIPVIPFS